MPAARLRAEVLGGADQFISRTEREGRPKHIGLGTETQALAQMGHGQEAGLPAWQLLP